MTPHRPIPFIIILIGIIFYFPSCSKISSPDNNPINNVTFTSLRPAHGPFDTIDTLTGKGFDQIPVLFIVPALSAYFSEALPAASCNDI